MSAHEGMRADIVWDANTGQAIRDLGEIGGVYARTTGAMSDESLRLAVATEKLNKTIKRSGAESTAAKAATLTYRKEVAALASEQGRGAQAAHRAGAAYASEERQIARVARGAIIGTGALHRLRGAAVFASTGFLGGYGLTYALRQVIGESSQLQEETEKTGVVFGRNAHDVQAWARTLALSFGISEGAALKAAGTFGNMLRPLGFGEQKAAEMSKRLVELSADMASFNNQKPDVVLQALASGLAGQVRPLRQYGVFLSQQRLQEEAVADGIAKKNAKLTQAQKIQAAYNVILKDTKLQQGDVARNTESLSVSQSKLTAELQDSEAIIGRALLPTEVRLTNQAAKYLDTLNTSGELQRKVNTGLHEASSVVHGLGDAYHAVAPPIRLVVKLLGGTEHAVKLLAIAFVGLKLKSLALDLGLTATKLRGVGAAAFGAAGELNVLAAAETRAATAGAGAAAGAGGVVGRIGAYTMTGAGAAAGLAGGGVALGLAGLALGLGSVSDAGGVHHLGGPLDVIVSDIPGGGGAFVNYIDPATGHRNLIRLAKGAKIGPAIQADILRRHPELANEAAPLSGAPKRGVDTPTRNFGGTPSPTPAGGVYRGAPLGRYERIQLTISAAEAAVARGDTSAKAALIKSLKDEIDYDREYEAKQRDLIRRGIGDAKTHAAILQRLYGEEQQALSEIASIEDKSASTAKSAAAKAKAARDKAAREREKELHDRLALREKELKNRLALAKLSTDTLVDDRSALAALIAFDKAQEKNLKLTVLEREDYHAKELAARKQLADLDKKSSGSESRAYERDLVSSLRDILQRFAPNAFPVPAAPAGGLADTRLYELVAETRLTNQHLDRIVKQSAFPASGYAISSAEAVAG